MNISDINYNGLKLLAADVVPSKYIFCPGNVAKPISWQIYMADNTVRDILFSDFYISKTVDKVGSEFFFNAKVVASSGIEDVKLEKLAFKNVSSNDDEIVFEAENISDFTCFPRVTYRLSELHFRAEIAIQNVGTMPIYWRPEMHFLINLPWTDGVPFEKHIVKTLAKKRLRISNSCTAINSVKASGKTSFELLNESAIGFNQLQDNKIWIGTSNEEEGLSFIFCNKTQRSTVVLKKLLTGNCLEVGLLSDIVSETDKKMTNPELQNLFPIAPQAEDVFAIEISSY